MAKAAEAFRTISEVADELNLHKHVLRFWEVKFPQIKPMKRGGGRRYYRPADMELLRGIRYLLHAEGYTIKGVQKILRERGVDAVKRFGAEVASGSEVTAGSKAPASPVAASPPAERDEISSAAPLPPRAKANPDRASDARWPHDRRRGRRPVRQRHRTNPAAARAGDRLDGHGGQRLAARRSVDGPAPTHRGNPATGCRGRADRVRPDEPRARVGLSGGERFRYAAGGGYSTGGYSAGWLSWKLAHRLRPSRIALRAG